MERIRIRRNGYSLYIRIPPEYAQSHNLKPGDVLGWKSGETEATLKLVARMVEQEVAPEPQEAA
jgi:antitoxin component of MazEF toxin-antitoxin module